MTAGRAHWKSDFTPAAPTDGKFAGRAIAGGGVVQTDRDAYDAGRAAAALLWAGGRVHPDTFVVNVASVDLRCGRPSMRRALLRGKDPEDVVARDAGAVTAWPRAVAPSRLSE